MYNATVRSKSWKRVNWVKLSPRNLGTLAKFLTSFLLPLTLLTYWVYKVWIFIKCRSNSSLKFFRNYWLLFGKVYTPWLTKKTFCDLCPEACPSNLNIHQTSQRPYSPTCSNYCTYSSWNSPCFLLMFIPSHMLIQAHASSYTAHFTDSSTFD